MQKQLWVKLNKNNFDSLIRDVNNNLNNNEFKTTINKKVYNLNNAQNFLVDITTQKVIEEGAFELYSNLIITNINELKNEKSESKTKRNKVSDISENLESVFTGAYLHYNDVPSESEENIPKRIDSIKGRLNEIKKKNGI